MKKKIDKTVKRDTHGDFPHGHLKRIDDMLLPPEELLPQDKA